MTLRVDVVTIFPELFPGPLGAGVVGKAMERGMLEVCAHDLRDHADPPHRQVDDEPFGGGAGMVFKPEPLFRCIEAVGDAAAAAAGDRGPVVLLSPQGRPFDQATARDLATERQFTLVCGRYEGIDERVREHVIDREISLGDYVVTGGELPAMVVIDAVARWIPETLGDPDSARQDSFAEGGLDHPHYTRPADYRGWRVPGVLRSGDHAAIAAWRRREALRNTARKRPDLLDGLALSVEERRFVDGLIEELAANDREDD